MDLSLIIIIHNTTAFVTNLLTTLKKISCKQIFLLNGMTDITTMKLFNEYKSHKNDVCILTNDTLLRHPVATNMLLAEVKSKYVFIMDSDILTTESDLNMIYKYLTSDKNIGAVQGILIYPQNNRIQSTGHIYYEWADYYGHYNSPLQELHSPLKRQSLSAGFAMYPMDIVRIVGGFDEFYSISLDGVEFSSRIGAHGYNMFCLPIARGYHFHSLFRGTISCQGQGEEGRYWATYGNILKNDLTIEIVTHPLFKDFSDYILVDCSTIKNMVVFLEGLGLTNKRIELKITDLAIEKIILHNVAPHSLLVSKYKILWICTNFMQIASNQYLFALPDRRNDYIIDMSANVLPVSIL